MNNQEDSYIVYFLHRWETRFAYKFFCSVYGTETFYLRNKFVPSVFTGVRTCSLVARLQQTTQNYLYLSVDSYKVPFVHRVETTFDGMDNFVCSWEVLISVWLM